MRKIIALALAVIMACSMTAALADGEVANIFWGGGTPLSSDPALNSASAGSNIIKLSHAGLMGFQLDENGEGKIAPELAEGYTMSEDGKTYVFTLREGLKWSDGSDFTASEVVFSWNRAASVDLGADYGFLFDVIDGYGTEALNVVADDAARTVTVQLLNPCPYFLDLCAFPVFYPVKEANVDAEGIWAVDPAKNVGMGPYRMTKYAVDDVIAYEKNEFYWNADAVKLGGINAYLSEDDTAMLTAYENGTADFILSINPSEYDRLTATYPGELQFRDLIGTWYVLFNVYKDYSPAAKQLSVQDQAKARVAIGKLINRYELVTYVTRGGQIAATGFYPDPLADGLNANVRESDTYSTWYTGTDELSEVNDKYTVDQVEAVEELIALGYAYEGTVAGGDIKFTDFPSIEFAFNNAGANALIIQYVQETFNTFGIPSTINTEAWATLQQKLKAGDAEAARMGWVADFNDCVNFLEIFISNSGNNYPRLGRSIGDYTKATDVTKDAGMGAYWGIDGDQTWAECYDALVTEIKATVDLNKRAELCAKAENILMATGGVAPMYFYTNPMMIKPYVENLIVMNTGDVLWNYVSFNK